MGDRPPPPPPHGTNPRKSSPNLPPGNYDIFIIPPHSSGSGFLYLPSLKPNVNSFVAGFASALALVGFCHLLAPVFRLWQVGSQGMGNMGVLLLIIAVGAGAWALGRTQSEGGSSTNGGDAGNSWSYNPGDNGGPSGAYPGTGPSPNSRAPDPDRSPPPPPPHGTPPPRRPQPPPHSSGADTPRSTWQERPQAETTGAEQSRSSSQQKEKDRKEKELREKRIQEARERELRDRLEREKALREKLEHEAKEREAREREAREREAREREAREQEAREREAREREAKEREARERELAQIKEAEAARAAKAAEEAKAREAETTRRSTYAFSSVGEKTNPWPNGKPPTAQAPSPAKSTRAPSVAPTAAPSTAASSARHPAPSSTVQSSRDMGEETEYSYRPYDQPKAHVRRRSGETVFTESSYAPSQFTARTTPPPSMRGPYTTKDPDKIVIKAVYGFLNQFSKTPASTLMSGVGSVTDGLILRITTEGLFIDDDVRGVPQREWDVKAWTLKLIEVWCPALTLADIKQQAAGKKAPSRFRYSARGQQKTMTGEEADAYLAELLHACKDDCRMTPHGEPMPFSHNGGGQWEDRGLHVLRATIRDQEGKRFLFVLDEQEGWKVAVGLQRLRRGSQVRQLGIQPMPLAETRNAVETLGW
ncbi:hypothetical protein GGR50DRAFT_687949 [Xylaria sp. CBS 124048]|nr:hypothetical protein GGR50DRAFT_687949 [Xylaria sp. CBS 124048]